MKRLGLFGRILKVVLVGAMFAISVWFVSFQFREPAHVYTGDQAWQRILFIKGQSIEFLPDTPNSSFNITAGSCGFFYLYSGEGVGLLGVRDPNYIQSVGNPGCKEDYYQASGTIGGGTKLEALTGSGEIQIIDVADAKFAAVKINLYDSEATQFVRFLGKTIIVAIIWIACIVWWENRKINKAQV